jgi:methylmalonyl-CoA mutase N-terminal domain/subunit
MIDAGETVVVGVNRFADVDPRAAGPPGTRAGTFCLDPEVEHRQVERVRAVRASRREDECRAALAVVEAAARGTTNLVPPIISAVEARATLGEIADAMRRVFGEHRDTSQ